MFWKMDILYILSLPWCFLSWVLNKLGPLRPVPRFLVGCKSQRRGHRAAAEHPPGKGASRTWAGEAAEPRGFLWGHKKEASRSRGEQGASGPWRTDTGPGEAACEPLWPASGRAEGEEPHSRLSLPFGQNGSFPFCKYLWNVRGLETFSPKGKKDLSQQLQVERCFHHRFPFLFFPPARSLIGEGLWLYRWTVTQSLSFSFPSLRTLVFPRFFPHSVNNALIFKASAITYPCVDDFTNLMIFCSSSLKNDVVLSVASQLYLFAPPHSANPWWVPGICTFSSL